jgi:uncharacterized protein
MLRGQRAVVGLGWFNSKRSITMSEQNKKLVQEINDAFARGDSETFLSHCKEDVSWTMVGEKETNGKREIREWMASMEGNEPPVFTVDKMIADGDSVACYGDMKMKNKEGVTGDYSYVDIYELDGEKIADLKSFVVKHKTEGEQEKAASA